jgi:hypothetical protein
MQREGVLDFAAKLGLGSPNRTSTAVWVHYRCPFAKWRHDNGKTRPDHFNVSVGDHKHSVYRCWSCHSKGTFPELAYELGRLRGEDLTALGKQIQEQELLGPKLYLPKWDEEIRDTFNESSAQTAISWPDPRTEYDYYSAAGHPYLVTRNVGAATAIKLGVRYDPFQRRVLFPVHDERGRFAGFTGRAISGPAYRTDDGEFESDGSDYLKVRDYFGLRKSEFFLGELGIREPGLSRRITLSEGIFDYAFSCEVGLPCPLAILGSWLTPPKIRKLIDWGRPVVLFMDNDGPGRDCAEHCIDVLFGKVPLLSVTYPDGYEDADPGSLPRAVIRSMANSAELVSRRP